MSKHKTWAEYLAMREATDPNTDQADADIMKRPDLLVPGASKNPADARKKAMDITNMMRARRVSSATAANAINTQQKGGIT